MNDRFEQMKEALSLVDEYNTKLKKICEEFNAQAKGGQSEDHRHKGQGLRSGY